jgi:TolB-like protein/DNA-binding winged helix-turn-helix (wHTH) protein/Flp pilus assembly protein TadD
MSTPAPTSNRIIRFGAFEADLRTGELRKHGTRIKLQDQPFQVLVMLLDHPGELITREEIQRKLWPADTFVDFDHSLNTAIRRLRDALSDSADTPRFVETLPRRGYRFIGQVEGRAAPNQAIDGAAFIEGFVAAVADAASVQPSAVAATQPIIHAQPSETASRELSAASPQPLISSVAHPESSAAESWDLALLKPSPIQKKLAWVAVVIVLAIAAVLIWKFRPWPAIDSIAVLPFVNEAKDPELDYLTDGIAESIMSNLSQVPTLKVMSRNSVFRYKGRAVDARQAAHELGVRAVLMGTVRQQGDNLRITIELVDARDQRQLWGETYNPKRPDLVAMQQEISQRTSEKLRLHLSGDVQSRMARRHTPTPEAYDAYLRGRHALNKRTNGDITKALAYFQEAIDRDPVYALPYVGISASYGLLAFYGGMAPKEAYLKEEAAARRALELDPESAETHTEMGYMLLSRHRDAAAAEREWKRALEIDPNSADAHHAYSLFLSDQGRFDEALREAARTEELDPLWPGSSGSTAWLLYYTRRYDDAIRKAQRAGSDFGPAYWVLGQVYEQQGKYKEAIEAFEQMLKRDPSPDPSNFGRAMLAHAYAVAGQRAAAQAILNDLLKLRQNAYFSAYNIAAVYAGLGDRRAMVTWLNTANDDRDPWLSRLRFDPRFDAFRSAPEFAELQRKLDTSD